MISKIYEVQVDVVHKVFCPRGLPQGWGLGYLIVDMIVIVVSVWFPKKY